MDKNKLLLDLSKATKSSWNEYPRNPSFIYTNFILELDIDCGDSLVKKIEELQVSIFAELSKVIETVKAVKEHEEYLDTLDGIEAD